MDDAVGDDGSLNEPALDDAPSPAVDSDADTAPDLATARRRRVPRLRIGRRSGTSLLLFAVLAGSVGVLASAGPMGATATRIEWVRCRRPSKTPRRCGDLARPFGSSGGAAHESVQIYFELDARRNGTRRPVMLLVQGGPGGSSTAIGEPARSALSQTLRGEDLLTIDLRGSGFSTPFPCTGGTLCPAATNDARWFSTAVSADDVAAVLDALGIDQVDLYGVSYGGYFAQVFATRHSDRIRSLVLDSPAYWEGTPWPDARLAAALGALRDACRRSKCASDPVADIRSLMASLNSDEPASDASSPSFAVLRHDFVIRAIPDLVRFIGRAPSLARDMPAALDAAVHRTPPDFDPLDRLIGTRSAGSASPPYVLSDSTLDAVACAESPMPFDPAATPAQKSEQLDVARSALAPDRFDPFTISEWLGFNYPCVAEPALRAVRAPIDARTAFPNVRTLVLVGSDDTVTPPSDVRSVAARFSGAHLVVVPGLGHAPGLSPGELQPCTDRLIADFMAERGTPRWRCDRALFASRAVPELPDKLGDVVTAGPAVRDGALVTALAESVLDARLHPLGLRGGEARYSDGNASLYEYEWMAALPINGTATFRAATGIRADISIGLASAHTGKVRLVWAAWGTATVQVDGTLDGAPIHERVTVL